MSDAWMQYHALWRMAFHDDDLFVMFGARCLILASHAVVVGVAAVTLAILAHA